MSHICIFIAIKDPFADWWIFTGVIISRPIPKMHFISKVSIVSQNPP